MSVNITKISTELIKLLTPNFLKQRGSLSNLFQIQPNIKQKL